MIDSSVWEGEPSVPLALAANEFKEEVQVGQHVIIGADGRLAVRHPDPLSDAVI